jgi:hypothetical protein
MSIAESTKEENPEFTSTLKMKIHTVLETAKRCKSGQPPRNSIKMNHPQNKPQ